MTGWRVPSLSPWQTSSRPTARLRRTSTWKTMMASWGRVLSCMPTSSYGPTQGVPVAKGVQSRREQQKVIIRGYGVNKRRQEDSSVVFCYRHSINVYLLPKKL
ncbi:unnamed protein product [Heterosigma akashiwo]